jgi:hypothetical protein
LDKITNFDKWKKSFRSYQNTKRNSFKNGEPNNEDKFKRNSGADQYEEIARNSHVVHYVPNNIEIQSSIDGNKGKKYARNGVNRTNPNITNSNINNGTNISSNPNSSVGSRISYESQRNNRTNYY